MDPIKTTVYLGEEDYRRLKRLAGQLDRPTAELIREAVREYGLRHAKKSQPRSVGAGHSKRGDLSERAEELLAGMGASPTPKRRKPR